MGDNKKGINPAAVGLGAAVIGAAAGAAAVLLSKPENRQKLQKGFEEAKSRGEELRTQGTKKLKELKNNLENSSEDTREKLEEAKEKLAKEGK